MTDLSCQVTDLTSQVTNLTRKIDLLLGRSGENFVTQTYDAAISDLLGSLPLKNDESFDHFNKQLKINQNKQAIVCRK